MLAWWMSPWSTEAPCGSLSSSRAAADARPRTPPYREAANSSSRNQCVKGTSTGNDGVLVACSLAATSQIIRLASLSRPCRTISTRDNVPTARSIKSALPSCARTRADPSPPHHTISSAPRRSSSSNATLSWEGTSPRRTGCSQLLWVRNGMPSDSRRHLSR